MFCSIPDFLVFVFSPLVYGNVKFFLLILCNGFITLCVCYYLEVFLHYDNLDMVFGFVDAFWYFSSFHFKTFAKLWQKGGVMLCSCLYACVHLRVDVSSYYLHFACSLVYVLPTSMNSLMWYANFVLISVIY